MSCDFCEKFDFGSAKTDVDKYFASIVLSGGSYRFPQHDRFNFCPVCGCAVNKIKVDDAFVTSKNDPLSLDEMQKMIGKPIWVEPMYADAQWYPQWIIYGGGNINVVCVDNPYEHLMVFGKIQAYRRPPNENST